MLLAAAAIVEVGVILMMIIRFKEIRLRHVLESIDWLANTPTQPFFRSEAHFGWQVQTEAWNSLDTRRLSLWYYIRVIWFVRSSDLSDASRYAARLRRILSSRVGVEPSLEAPRIVQDYIEAFSHATNPIVRLIYLESVR
jgi:hypothetical protein